MRKVCIVIQSLVSRLPNHHSGYSLDREKHHTLLTLKRRKNVVYDVTNVVNTSSLVRCKPSTPWRDPKTGELARSRRRRAQPFFLNHCRSEDNRANLPGLFKPTRGNAFRASHLLSEKLELFKKLDPGAQFQSERISSTVQPHRSLRGSEAKPTTYSWYSSFRGRERSLDLRRLRRAVRHSRTNSASPKGLRRLSAFGSHLRRGKVRLAFRLLTASCTSPEQSGEGSLKRQPTCLRQRKYSQSVKDQWEDVHGARLRPAF